MDAEARFEAMYRAHCGAVRTFVHRRMAPTVAHDVVSDVFLAAWRRLDQAPDDALPCGSRRSDVERAAAAQFAVFRRPQTAKDRSLPALVRGAAGVGGPTRGPGSVLGGAIPSLTRSTQTLPDGREVFLAVYRPSALPHPAPRAFPAGVLLVRVIMLRPDGKPTEGQPVSAPGSTETARDADIIARNGPQGCVLHTYWNIVPDRVARIRWQFGRRDRGGRVYGRPLTVDMTVRDNVAVTTIPARATCDRPAAVTRYGRDGRVLSHAGTA